MESLLLGSLLTLISLLIGFQLGKHQDVVSSDTKKQIQQIFKKVVPNPEVGAIARPTVEDNFYRDNPLIAKEYKKMEETFDQIIK